MGGELVIQFDDGELKNGEPATMPLPPECARFLKLFINRFRGKIGHQNSPYLFIGRGPDKPKARDGLSAQLTKLIFDRLGLSVTPHLYRHIRMKTQSPFSSVTIG